MRRYLLIYQGGILDTIEREPYYSRSLAEMAYDCLPTDTDWAALVDLKTDEVWPLRGITPGQALSLARAEPAEIAA